MRSVGQLLAVTGVVVVATIGSISAQAASPAVDATAQSFAQADKPSTAARVKTWTRAKLDAAKKRWAADKAKFEDCQKQLLEERKTKKLSIHKQGHFLQACMNKKP